MSPDIQTFLEHNYGPNLMVVCIAIVLSYLLNHKVKTVPVAIFTLLISIMFFQMELVEHMHIDSQISVTFGFAGLIGLSIAMIPIGLEIQDFSVFVKPKFIAIISMIVGVSLLLACFISMESYEKTIGYAALLLTSSLAVLNVFIQVRPKILHTNLVKLAMPIGFTTDCVLWIIISLLKINHEVGISLESVMPQLIVLFGSMLVVFLGVKWWWNIVPKHLNIGIWVWVGSGIAFAFYAVGFSPVLGAIFGGLVVPSHIKHKFAHEYNKLFDFAMVFYMASVGFKIHELIDLESFKMAIEIILLTSIVKFLGIKYSGLFGSREIAPALYILGNGGTMLIAAGIALSSTLSDGTSILPHNTSVVVAIVACLYTVAAAIYFQKNPIEVDEHLVPSEAH